MSFLARQLLQASRQPNLINSLTQSLRSLSVTPCVLSKLAAPQQVAALAAAAPNKVTAAEQKECQDVFQQVNAQLKAGAEGRMFAVVHLCGKQFKVTAGDIILVEGYWPPTIGDEISLDKVLLAGANDFTLVGRPILDKGLVNVRATVIEKTLTHTKTHFKKKRRKQYLRTNFQRSPNTMLRINTIEVAREVDKSVSAGMDDKRLF